MPTVVAAFCNVGNKQSYKHRTGGDTFFMVEEAYGTLQVVAAPFQATDKQTNKLEGHSVERMYLRQRCFDGSVNKTIVKPCIAAAAGCQYVGPIRGIFRT